ncbi:glycerol-3-phosphate dehydrogenase [Prosthecomicrobium hirschii]|uniref:Glycerol-3-phosphate dehydrogenase n=1 Tax=Prosthecodimorpha hirschii TaxID=665126 RepID=A0A0P6VMD2_9HYPH|nr:glycerol-3-phosphate dehydrogenase [Prosthecomicrobium hirschii]KPL53845.1 glycerol-3-phosphate dehydrogenase [Prosthecomicrobium hirschii]
MGVAERSYDLAVVGGGVNGCGIARDAAGRGLTVLLAEQGDLASATSSASTKLVHGGLRYLEYYEFRLVREALIEREVLLRAAPHFIWPLRFVLPHHSGLRPRWMIRLGLFLYDHLGGRKILPGTRAVDLRTDPIGKPLRPEFRFGFEYSDCWVEDARLVVMNARDAADRGVDIRTRTRVVSARREDGLWRVRLEDRRTGAISEIRARALVNAAGPWVSEFLGGALGRNDPDRVRMVKGSHIVVPRLYDHDRCYIFQNADGRICFTIPYEQDFTLIGTTDLDYRGNPGEAAIDASEIAYLCEAVSAYFVKPVKPADVVWTYSGVRPLYDDGASKAQEATRDYVLKLEGGDGQAPLINVFGGKITTARKLAEAALEKLAPFFPTMGAPWTDTGHLPGGGIPVAAVPAAIAEIRTRHPYLSERHAARLFRYYGTKALAMLGDARSLSDLGRLFGADLTAREVDHLMRTEWAETAEDILWRRSKLGLRFKPDEVAALDSYMAARRGDVATGAVLAAQGGRS